MGLFDKIKDLLSTEKSESQKLPSTEKPAYSLKSELISEKESNNKIEDDSMIDKAKDFLAGTANEVKEQGSQLWDQVKDKAADLNEATKEYREKLAAKANEALEKMDDFVDHTLEKANKLKEEENARDADKDGFADKPIDFGKQLSESREDFFSKAEQWLDKNESADKNHPKEINETKESNNHKVINPIELPKDPE